MLSYQAITGNKKTKTGELLARAAERQATELDEKLFFDLSATPSPMQGQSRRAASMSGLPVEQAYRLADRAEEQRRLGQHRIDNRCQTVHLFSHVDGFAT
jgi:hypothetical protein